MADLIEAFRRATGLIVTIDPNLVEILMLSVQVSLSAIAIASVLGFAIGGALAVYRFPGRGAVSAVLSALMGLPPVVAGLVDEKEHRCARYYCAQLSRSGFGGNGRSARIAVST